MPAMWPAPNERERLLRALVTPAGATEKTSVRRGYLARVARVDARATQRPYGDRV